VELIPIFGAELYYDPHFLSPEEASRLLNLLMEKCAWERRQAAFGHAVPREEAYYGDPGAYYTYSRREYKPLAWIPELLTLRVRVEAATPEAAYSNLSLQRCPYNAVLCNLYRGGYDSVGLHADNEAEMGPVIASVSLGAERLFRLRQKGEAIAFSERLSNGSLLIMAGRTQENFKHEVPKEPNIMQPRINLTFRRIEHE
jgi:alkylated DNA repair dioxygenase AlkB